MPLVNANEITMVTIRNLITTSIKDVCGKKKRAVSITTVAFINKFQNNCTQPEIIKERIKRLIKNEALKNKPFNGHMVMLSIAFQKQTSHLLKKISEGNIA